MNRVVAFGLFSIVVIAALGAVLFLVPAPQLNEEAPNEVPDDVPQDVVSIEAEFDGKIVYTMNAGLDALPFENHCTELGGVFNACGSPCEPGAEACAAVCAYTCEFSAPLEEEVFEGTPEVN